MIGEKLRQHRKRFGYTLQELSKKTNLSVGYLSNIERDAASPTLETLEILCNALRIDVVELLRSDRSPSPLMKKSERRRVYADRDGVLENVVVENDLYRCTCYTMRPEFRDPITVPAGDSGGILCYVLSGELELTMDGTTYHMEEGDTIFIGPHTPHSFRQLGDKQNVTLWFYSSGLRI